VKRVANLRVLGKVDNFYGNKWRINPKVGLITESILA
jgi:hypothetical protein